MPGKVVNAISEAVVKPVVDELAKAVEEGVASLNPFQSNTTDPQDEAKKAQEEQKRKQEEEVKKRNIKQFFDGMQANENALWQEKNQQAQIKQQASAEENEKKQVKQFEIVKKKENMAVIQKQTKVESKRGGA